MSNPPDLRFLHSLLVDFIKERTVYLTKIDPIRSIFFSRSIKCQIIQFLTWYHSVKSGMY